MTNGYCTQSSDIPECFGGQVFQHSYIQYMSKWQWLWSDVIQVPQPLTFDWTSAYMFLFCHKWKSVILSHCTCTGCPLASWFVETPVLMTLPEMQFPSRTNSGLSVRYSNKWGVNTDPFKFCSKGGLVLNEWTNRVTYLNISSSFPILTV